jgi:SRSO17 transposase
VRTLQEFLKDHDWDFEQVRDLLQGHTADVLAPLEAADGLGAVGLVDETGTAKKGDKTPGVQRQYLGCSGKVDNGIVTVHRGVCKGPFKGLIDADLYLPKGWSDDRPRCRAAGIPDELVHRPKWQIALAQLDRAHQNGIRFDWFTFDEGYGDKPGYLEGLDQRKLRYVGEVPRSFRCYGRKPRPGQRARRACDLVRHSPLFCGPDGQVVRLARQTVGDQQWQVKAARVYLAWGGDQTYWLVWARNVRTGEQKYFVSNAAQGEPVGRIVRAAFCRWNVEHALRLSKSGIGFRHFEGRNYKALMRHRTLCCATMTFVAGHAAGLRGGKPGGHPGAGVPRTEPGLPPVAGPAARHDPTAVHVGGHLLSPAA